MGVDAEMFVKIKGRESWLSDNDVKTLAYEIGSSFATNVFFTMNPQQGLFKEERRALEIMKPTSRDDTYFDEESEGEFVGKVVWHQDGDPIIANDDEQFIRVHLYGRYYGKDYERGDWPTIRAVILWLNIRIPNGCVWYGGDSSGLCAEFVTASSLAEMDRHWAVNGRRPYVRYESDFKGMFNMPADSIEPPVCGLCSVPMADCGGSRDYTFFWCDACGTKASAHANGNVVFAKKHDDYPMFDENGNAIPAQLNPHPHGQSVGDGTQ